MCGCTAPVSWPGKRSIKPASRLTALTRLLRWRAPTSRMAGLLPAILRPFWHISANRGLR
jgi:hypothetical protein